ncbi:response regulator [Breoghania sp.]|uniref:response regulator n=1 Tax=Breoghania sp. TaxID=2065378 RepID=UPI003204974F
MIVEDDAEIRDLLADLLTRENFIVRPAMDAAGMDRLFSEKVPDLVILNIMLPGEDGLSTCRRLRAKGTMPILMLTAKGREVDQVVGLEMGADDYVVKPFAPLEMIARIRALLRRASMPSQTPAQAGRRYRVRQISDRS